MNVVSCFAKGWRTISAVLAFIIAGFLGVLGTIDLTPVIALFVKDPELLGAAMVFVGLLFGFLRYVTTTPLFSAAPDPHRGADSEVDEAPMDLKRDVDTGA